MEMLRRRDQGVIEAFSSYATQEPSLTGCAFAMGSEKLSSRPPQTCPWRNARRNHHTCYPGTYSVCAAFGRVVSAPRSRWATHLSVANASRSKLDNEKEMEPTKRKVSQ